MNGCTKVNGRWTNDPHATTATRVHGAPGPVYSARRLLEALETGATRDRLALAMHTRDLDSIRAMMQRHRRRAMIATPRARACPYVGQVAKPRGWTMRDTFRRTRTRPETIAANAGAIAP